MLFRKGLGDDELNLESEFAAEADRLDIQRGVAAAGDEDEVASGVGFDTFAAQLIEEVGAALHMLCGG